MTELPRPECSRAVLVGFSEYAHLQDLPAVANNLTDFAAVLQDRWLWGLPDDRCTVVTDSGGKRISSKDVLDAVNDGTRGVRAGGLLLVYYAGHGLVDADSGRLYLAVGDSERVRKTRRPWRTSRSAGGSGAATPRIVW